jgi:hypothetical protein
MILEALSEMSISSTLRIIEDELVELRKRLAQEEITCDRLSILSTRASSRSYTAFENAQSTKNLIKKLEAAAKELEGDNDTEG